MAQAELRKTRSYYINSAVALGIIALFHFLPPVSTLTRTGMDVAGIFIGVIYAFSTVDIIWPALLGIVLLGTTELYTMTGAFAAAFGGDTWLFPGKAVGDLLAASDHFLYRCGSRQRDARRDNPLGDPLHDVRALRI